MSSSLPFPRSLSAREREALLDRLCVPDAIVDALSGEYGEDEVSDACDVLADWIGNITPAVRPSLSDCERAVLWDAVDGSVWECDSEGDMTPAQKRARSRTVDSLRRKVGAYLGECGVCSAPPASCVCADHV